MKDLLNFCIASDYQSRNVRLNDRLEQLQQENARLNNAINEIEAIVYADISNIDARISIQDVLDKLKEQIKK